MNLKNISLLAILVFASFPVQAASNDADVAKLQKDLEKSDKFSPEDFTRTMNLIEKIGSETATPHLVSFLKNRSNNAEKVYFACEATERYGTIAAVEAVESWLEDKSWLVRGTCAAAYGKLLAKDEENVAARKKGATRLLQMIQAEMKARQPQTAIKVAEALGWVIFDAEGAHEALNQWAEKGDYWTRQIGLASMLRRQKYNNISGPIAVQALGDKNADPAVRTAAAQVVTSLKIYGARDTLRAVASEAKDPGGNLLASVYEAMGAVGTKEDLAILKKGIKKDVRGPAGFQASKAKEAIRAIEGRLTMDEKGEL